MIEKSEIAERVQSIFRNIFDDENLLVKEETEADDIEDWDSFSHIKVVVALEREFSIQFPMKRAMDLRNVGDIINLVFEMTELSEV